jgi:hypothetical protein
MSQESEGPGSCQTEDVGLTHEYVPIGMKYHSLYGCPVGTSIRGFRVKSWLPDEVVGDSIHQWLLDNEAFNLLLDDLTGSSSSYMVIKFIELQEDMVIIHLEDDCVAIYKLEEVEDAGLGKSDTLRAPDGAAGEGSVEGGSEDTPAP